MYYKEKESHSRVKFGVCWIKQHSTGFFTMRLLNLQYIHSNAFPGASPAHFEMPTKSCPE